MSAADAAAETQATELSLLAQIAAALPARHVVDVGAGHGLVLERLLAAAPEARFDAFEPLPAHYEALKRRFAGELRVILHPQAIDSRDGTARLHLAADAQGQEQAYFHSLHRFIDTESLSWGRDIEVETRSLDSLVQAGILPGRIDILKIDTEGHDAAVVAGLGRLDCAVIMVEYWTDLPTVIGRCPWRLQDMADELRGRGFHDYVFIKRRDEYEAVQVNVPDCAPGEWGNVLFLAEPVAGRLAPLIARAVADAQSRLMQQAAGYHQICRERQAVIDRLSAALKTCR